MKTNYEGRVFGYYTVEQYLYTEKSRPVYRCRDIFGNCITASSKSFSRKSFGTNFSNEDSIRANRLLRAVYCAIIDRCYNIKNKSFQRYGGRDIVVCDLWLGKDGYHNFLFWATSSGYSRELCIDRIDNDKGYSPENCRWVNRKVSGRNRRKVILSEKAATEIRAAYVDWMGSDSEFYKRTASMYTCSAAAIQKLINGYSWM